jgi:hypothetical protein
MYKHFDNDKMLIYITVIYHGFHCPFSKTNKIFLSVLRSENEVNVKVKLSLRHENLWENGGIAPPFLASALDGGEWSASCLGRFTLGEKIPGTHWIGG